FDEEVESIRQFDPETQRSSGQVDNIHLLPAREFPLHDESIKDFRRNFRNRFEGNLGNNVIYNDIGQNRTPNGIEYFLPLFFEQTSSLIDYLPEQALVIHTHDHDAATDTILKQIHDRYEQRRHDVERPILTPDELYLQPQQLSEKLGGYPSIQVHPFEQITNQPDKSIINFSTSAAPMLLVQSRSEQPVDALQRYLDQFDGQVLILAESAGRREVLLEMFRRNQLLPRQFDNLDDFLGDGHEFGIAIAPLEQGVVIENPSIALITETQLFGERAQQIRRRRKSSSDADQIIRSLSDLNTGDPVVHEEHGIGRYQGLTHLTVGNQEREFLLLEYADENKLYVPVASLHLISRYSGASADSAPLHRLGGDHWQKLKRKAAQKVRDVAVELLDIYAKRAARSGYQYRLDEQDYDSFTASFPFEETPDQQDAIDAVVDDMRSPQPMDRVVCGDVGFGKTEVAMRAAFVAVQDGKQVAILVPTTLLAQQHYQNFLDRFADWPFRIEVLSRFRSKKDTEAVLHDMANGKVDLVIGTHKLIQKDIKFHELGLIIIDEEHRFGVRHKEQLKKLRAEVDILTLTATPIPRTLNMSLSGLRDLSIIATPPADRVAIKTFVTEWDDVLINEAFSRELNRGGQIYFLHNNVSTIEKTAKQLHELVPEARIAIAHGQMSERELEQIMLDFYHQRYNILVCTTIIESGIDIPTANTIIIDRADKLGLAQLHQIRGRVGRSHHRAYAYLLIPDQRAISKDAIKRLQAIESMEDLGAGFMLATHDLEIRGAGELLGEGQSGQIHEIGFTLYTELLERAVKALKSGQQPELDAPLEHGPEIDLHLPALIPEDYLPDVHTRLIMYKRLASAADLQALHTLQVEMIDRFGLMPDPLKNLVLITELKLIAIPMGIRKIDVGPAGGRIQFGKEPDINSAQVISYIQQRPDVYKLDGMETFRIKQEMEEPQQRQESVRQLLESLSP
ncbi:MAG TPA: transcription-repair coupling factor, partial [Gammaproteobacteria bacterium]|nr:transcription-repair coupling factor [Gammaproteobacteria bacterium]